MRNAIKLAAAMFWIILASVPRLEAATGTLAPSPYLTVLNSSGAPISGACVWTYTAGTSTPVATYKDKSISVANSNPIVADSAGQFVAYLVPGASYKFVFEAACVPPAHAAELRTQDGIDAVTTATPIPQQTYANGFRLTLTAGTCFTTADVLAAGTLFWSPCQGNIVTLFNTAGTVESCTSSELSIAVPALTSQMYDVWVFDSAFGTCSLSLELLAWTNDTTRATGISRLSGRYTKTGDTSRLYVGSFRTTTVANQTESSVTKRYLWNYYNRARQTLRKTEATANWAYAVSAWRYANNSPANQVEVVIGVAEVMLSLTSTGGFGAGAATANGSVGIGEDTAVALMTGVSLMGGLTQAAVASPIAIAAFVNAYPAVGRHFYAFIENAFGFTDTFYGAGGVNTAGIMGYTEG